MSEVLMVVMGLLIGFLIAKIMHRRFVERLMRELDLMGEILNAKTHQEIDELKDKYPHLRGDSNE